MVVAVALSRAALGCCRLVGCRCCLVSLHLSPFTISILGCSWLPPCLPSFVALCNVILGCSWLPLPPCLPSLSPFMMSGLLLRPLPPCLPSLSPFMISVLRCAAALSPKLIHSGLLLAAAAALSPKFVSLHDLRSGPFLAAAAALSLKLVSLYDLHSGLLLAAALSSSLSPFMISILGCSWLPPCLPIWAALGFRLVLQACPPS